MNKPSVRLIAATTPINSSWSGKDGAGTRIPVTGETLEQFIAFCARVSNPSNQGSHGTSGKLLNYLAENAHWSPFEMAHAVLEITTTRDIARQILRHRSFSFQEFSQRYGAQTSFHPGRPLRWQDVKNRQNSLIPEGIDPKTEALKAEWMERQQAVICLARDNYEWALSQGIAKEVSRSVLPEGLTTSKLYMAGTIRSWMHYLQIRTDPSTQLEHREVAEMCGQALRSVFPGIEKFVKLNIDPASNSKKLIEEIEKVRAVVSNWALVEGPMSIQTINLEQQTYSEGLTVLHFTSHHRGDDLRVKVIDWFASISPDGEIVRLDKFPTKAESV
jgi:thymidylate synthase (FAD)